jgi:hypothetical protein
MKNLIAEYPEHIKGYGFLSDLMGGTYRYGLQKDVYDMYDKVWCEFEEDSDLNPYEPQGVPTKSIPRGTLKVFGEKKNTLF